MNVNKGKIYSIYIGLKDKDTYQEVLTATSFKEILCEHCKKKEIGFSCSTLFGGYTHNKGYVTETSLKITLIGADIEEVKSLTISLKDIVNTDTVLITEEDCRYLFY